MYATIICRLCLNTRKDSRSLYDEHNQPNGLYQMIYEYFHPKILDMEKAKHLTDICMACFGQIQTFLCFQSLIIRGQLKLMEEEKTVSTIEVQAVPNSQDQLLTHPVTIEVDDEDEFVDVSPQKDCTDSLNVEQLLTHPVTIKVDDEDEFVDVSPQKDCTDSLNVEQLLTHPVTIKVEDEDEFVDVSPQKDGTDSLNVEQLLTHPVTIKVDDEDEFVDVSPQKDCTDSLNVEQPSECRANLAPNESICTENESLTLPDSPIENSPQTCQIEDRNISLSKAEIADVDTASANTTDDDLPLAQAFAGRQAVSKTLRSDDATVSVKRYGTADNLLAKWIPNINCVKCQLSFPRWKALMHHFKRQHPDDEFYITCCSRQFKTREQVRDHLMIHEDPNIFKCHLCGTNYTSRQNFARHKVEKHPFTPKFTCKECGKRSHTKRGLAVHYSEMHNYKIRLSAGGRSMYICQICGKTCKSLEVFRAHRLKKHLSNSEFACTVCGLTFRSSQRFREHEEAVHHNRQIYKCTYCSRVYARVSSIMRHRKMAHPLESKKNCYSIYINESSKDQNEQLTTNPNSNSDSTMSGDNAMLDPNKAADSIPSTSKGSAADKQVNEAMGNRIMVNSEDFNSDANTEPKAGSSQEADDNASLDFQNTQKHISLPKLEITDVDTGTETDTEDEISLPQQTKKKLEPPRQKRKAERRLNNLLEQWMPEIKCSSCPETFPLWSLLQNHFRKKHPKAVSYISCCSLQFSNRDKLRDHLLLHGDPDIFNCHQCGTKYVSTQSLGMHKAVTHPEQCEFECKACGRGFSTKNRLEVHYREMHNTDRNDRPDFARHKVEKHPFTPKFTCKECGKRSHTKRGLAVHYSEMHNYKIRLSAGGRSMYICQICGKTCKSLEVFRAHRLKKHLSNSEFACTVCGLTFRSSQRFREHEKAVHHNRQIYKCAYCSRVYARVSSIMRHRKMAHPLESKKNCYSIYINESSKYQNEELTTNPNSNSDSTMSGDNAMLDPNKAADSIPSTSKGSAADKQVNEAMGNRIMVNSEDFNSDANTEPKAGSSQEADDNASLDFQNTQKHISLPKLEITDVDTGTETATEDEISLPQQTKKKLGPPRQKRKAERRLNNLLEQWMPEIKCSSCPETFPLWSQLQNHFRKKHPKAVSYISCCSLQFSNRDKLRDHLLLHGDPDIFNCHQCGTKYVSSQSLGMHKAFAHPEQCEFVCKACGRGFSTKNSLEVHYREMHNTDRKDRPDIHVLADGRTAYTCKLCGVTTYTIYTFRAHRSLKHLNISKYVCTVCGRSCTTARRLREHEAIHQNKLLYKCAFCSKTYRTLASISLHRKRKHPLDCNNKNYYININESPVKHNVRCTRSIAMGSTMTADANLAPNNDDDTEQDNIPSTSKSAAVEQQVSEDKGEKVHISGEDFKPDAETVETYLIYEYGDNQEYDKNEKTELDEMDITEDEIPLTKCRTVKRESHEKFDNIEVGVSSPEKRGADDLSNNRAKTKDRLDDLNNPNAFKCVYCGKCCPSGHGLSIHVSRMHGAFDQSSNLAKTKDNLDGHNDPNGFKCVYCGKCCPSGHGLTIHVSRMHPAAKHHKFSCQQCGKRIRSKKLLRAHKKKCQRTRRVN